MTYYFNKYQTIILALWLYNVPGLLAGLILGWWIFA